MDINQTDKVASGISSGPQTTTARQKILLLDDDPVFRGVMIALAKARNIDIDAYESLQELDTFLQIESYNGMILDHHLAERLASEDISGLDAFFSSRPVLLVSADEGARHALDTQPAFRKFVPKMDGPKKILDELESLITKNPGKIEYLH
jgi:DNA-binding response OmpR family regulator